MTRIVAVGELAPDRSLTKLSTEVATLARALADGAGGAEVVGLVHGGAGPTASAATELAGFVPAVLTDARLGEAPRAVDIAAALATTVGDDDVVLLPASPNGRDIAGALSGLTGKAVLGNATAARWSPDGPIVEMSAFGGKLITESAFTAGHGIITVRPNAVTAVARDGGPGSVGAVDGSPVAAQPAVRLVEQVAEEAAAVSIDDARIIVSGGRGVGSPDGFALVQDLATELGGAVGATRAAVDSGWIPYAQQIGQTGKIVKPQLYLALGISGAIQHKVGMQTAGTIIAVNRDPDAPIAGFADMFVVGDLFEVGPALLAALRARRG
jgi:electron transfer flavoprotein alpha subunit